MKERTDDEWWAFALHLKVVRDGRMQEEEEEEGRWMDGSTCRVSTTAPIAARRGVEFVSKSTAGRGVSSKQQIT